VRRVRGFKLAETEGERSWYCESSRDFVDYTPLAGDERKGNQWGCGYRHHDAIERAGGERETKRGNRWC
jgi:hypothetical protein